MKYIHARQGNEEGGERAREERMLQRSRTVIYMYMKQGNEDWEDIVHVELEERKEGGKEKEAR